MNSKMEQIIADMEAYIDDCKVQPLSSGTKIIVNREQIEELLEELRMKIPEEVKRYQKIISNQEAILADARMKADEIIAQAQIQNNELVSEHEIMQQAYAQANEVVMVATRQAQEILDHATKDANDIRLSAISYTDEMLKNMEAIISNTIETSKSRTDSLVSGLQGYLNVIVTNRSELVPQVMGAEAPEQKLTEEQPEEMREAIE